MRQTEAPKALRYLYVGPTDEEGVGGGVPLWPCAEVHNQHLRFADIYQLRYPDLC